MRPQGGLGGDDGALPRRRAGRAQAPSSTAIVSKWWV